MMPTTSAASTPSRSAIKNAESTGCPVGLVVSHLQLQIRVYLTHALPVNRTNSVLFPWQQHGTRNRLFCLLRMATPRQALSLILSGFLLFSPICSAQSPPATPQAYPQRVKPDLKRSRKAAEQGEKAEAAGRPEEALADYEEAARYAPQDLSYAARAEALRGKLVRSYTDAAERDALASRFDQATEDLAAALAIDPTNSIVLERLRQIKSMADETGPKAAPEIPGLPRLKPQPGKHHVDLRGDTKTVYEQLAAMFGVRATFDPDLVVRNVRLNVSDVDFNNAVTILAAQTGTFWRPVNATLMFVAADNPEKRRQYDLEAEQTFPLSSAISSEEATEVVRILRDITASTRIDLDSGSHAITMRDTPERLALAGALIQQIERARGELMLEIELLEVDRNTARKLGIEPPTSYRMIALPPNLLSQVINASNLTALESLLAGIFGSAATGGGTSISSLIPPLVAVGGGKSTFLLTLPSAAADFSDALSLVQSGRQVLLRAQDGKPATFFVGQRYPVSLSLLSGSLGTSGFAPSLGAANNPFPSTSYAAGTGPIALVAADFLNNGSLDLAAVNEIDNSNSILLSRGDGTLPTTPSFTFFLSRQLAIATTSLPDGVLNSSAPYSAQLQSMGGTAAVTWSLATGTLPAGLSLNATTGAITGTPTAAGTSAFMVNARDSANPPNSATTALSITISTTAPTFAISTAELPNGSIGTPYDQMLTATGGTGTLTWSVSSGSLATGLSLNAKTGEITGTPAPATPGISFPFTITVTDSSAAPLTAQKEFTLTPVSAAEQGPVAVVQNDFNGDGNQDLAIVNQTTNNVTVLLGRGDGTFTEASGSPVSSGKGPVAISAGDLNGDAKPDLAVVNQTDATVSILLNNGDATFTAATGSPLAAASSPTGVAIADFNQDGHADIAVPSAGANTFRVFAGLGAGLFSLAVEPPAGPSGSTPTAIVAGTFAAGGFPEVAIANDVSGAAGDVTVVSANLSSGGVAPGVAQQPYPASEYVDLGLKIKATPTLHSNNEVTLQLEFEIRALSGTNVNGIPILSNRTLSQTVRLKENQPTLITGMADNEETRSIAGLPGFAEIPGVRYAFRSKSKSLQDTELLIVVTPRRLRLADHLTRTIYAGRGDIGHSSTPGFRGTPAPTLPQPPPPQPQPQPPLQQQPLQQQPPQPEPQQPHPQPPPQQP